MGQVSFLVCDECQALGLGNNSEGVESWQINRDDGRARVDLCPEHAAPLRHLLVNYGETFSGAAAAGINRNYFNSMISTMDEIAQLRTEFIAKHGDVTRRT